MVQALPRPADFTDITFALAAVPYDPHGRVSDAAGNVTAPSIVIHQTGGAVKDQVFEVGDDPLFKVGEEVVLFVHEYDPTNAPGYFYVIGGPQGRFRVANGKVASINDEGIKLAPKPLADFLDDIRKA